MDRESASAYDAAPTAPSLPEVHRTVTVPAGAGFWRKLVAFSGPGFLIAVGYMDPGNWAADIAGGSQFAVKGKWVRVVGVAADSKYETIGESPGLDYQPRQAAYDLKRLRGKEFVRKIDSHRYEPLAHGLRAMTALIVLRDKVIKPLLAASSHAHHQPCPSPWAPIDRHYQALQLSMKDLFKDLGIAA